MVQENEQHESHEYARCNHKFGSNLAVKPPAPSPWALQISRTDEDNLGEDVRAAGKTKPHICTLGITELSTIFQTVVVFSVRSSRNLTESRGKKGISKVERGGGECAPLTKDPWERLKWARVHLSAVVPVVTPGQIASG